MSEAQPVRCKKCGKPIGRETVLAQGVSPFQQPVPNMKIVVICMDCYSKAKNSKV